MITLFQRNLRRYVYPSLFSHFFRCTVHVGQTPFCCDKRYIYSYIAASSFTRLSLASFSSISTPLFFFQVYISDYTPSTLVAPSPRILAYLAQRGRYHTPSMALTTVDRSFPVEEKEIHNSPPEVVVTPCDPLPRPYYLEGGLRRVAPYHYTYNTYCKERWRGRGLLDVFGTEFRDRPREYYVR